VDERPTLLVSGSHASTVVVAGRGRRSQVAQEAPHHLWKRGGGSPTDLRSFPKVMRACPHLAHVPDRTSWMSSVTCS
jgi:hypothetical protein